MKGFSIISTHLLKYYIKAVWIVHPSLLPSFKGLNAIEKAYSSGVKYTGVTIHYVDEGIDTGTIIAQTPVYISPVDSLDDLKENIHREEHRLYPLVVKGLLAEKSIDSTRS